MRVFCFMKICTNRRRGSNHLPDINRTTLNSIAQIRYRYCKIDRVFPKLIFIFFHLAFSPFRRYVRQRRTRYIPADAGIRYIFCHYRKFDIMDRKSLLLVLPRGRNISSAPWCTYRLRSSKYRGALLRPISMWKPIALKVQPFPHGGFSERDPQALLRLS